MSSRVAGVCHQDGAPREGPGHISHASVNYLRKGYDVPYRFTLGDVGGANFWRTGCTQCILVSRGSLAGNIFVWLIRGLCPGVPRKGNAGCLCVGEEHQQGGFFLAVSGVVLVVGYKMLKLFWGDVWEPSLFLAIYPGQTTAFRPYHLAALALLFAVFVKETDILGRCNRL